MKKLLLVALLLGSTTASAWFWTKFKFTKSYHYKAFAGWDNYPSSEKWADKFNFGACMRWSNSKSIDETIQEIRENNKANDPDLLFLKDGKAGILHIKRNLGNMWWDYSLVRA